MNIVLHLILTEGSCLYVVSESSDLLCLNLIVVPNPIRNSGRLKKLEVRNKKYQAKLVYWRVRSMFS